MKAISVHICAAVLGMVTCLVTPLRAAEAPSFVLSGKWDGSLLPGARDEAESFWTASKGATATWSPGFDGPVKTRVAVHRIVHTDGKNDPAVTVEVHFSGKVEQKTLDYTMGESGWLELGTFDFSGGPTECVKLIKTTPSVTTRASAVRFDVLGGSNEVIQSFTLDEVTSGPLARPATKPFDPANVRSGPREAAAWTKSFQDEFDGDSINSEVWSIEAGSPGHITSSRWPENVVVKDGVLSLLTKKESRGGKEWTTGNIWTRTFAQQYGYFEARMKIGAATGLNNAFWLMTPNKPTDPIHFEIDISEAKYPFKNNISLHNWSGKHSASGKQWRAPYNLANDFHLYALEWNEKELIWFFDGEEIHRMSHDFCHLSTPIRLSSAVAPFAGKITDALDGTSMQVDYVRVWTKK